MNNRSVGFLLGALALLPVVGCATTAEGPASLQAAQSPAWSAKAVPNEMIVAVSPAGKSLRVLGSSGIVLGASADAIVNAKFRAPIREALNGYDAAEVFRGIIKSRLEEALGREIAEVAPLGSTAGMSSRKEAQDARYASLGRRGADVVLDLVMTFGIYGSDGTLATKLDGKLVAVPDGDSLWDNVLVVTNEPILANAKLGDPTKRMGMTVMNPEFVVDDEKMAQWTADGGAILRERFEMAASAAVGAMLCDLGLANDAAGEYALGKLAMNRKKFKLAAEHFENAIKLDPDFIDARNGHAVNMSHFGQVDDAIAVAKSIADTNSDYGPAWFNLAWWYATKKNDAAAAKSCYEKALALGMPKDGRIEKAIRKPG